MPAGPMKIQIDYPAAGEAVQPGPYTFRVAAGLPGIVELSLDDGDWQACREAVGYWWSDARLDGNGRHSVTARLTSPNGKVWSTPPRMFVVGGTPVAPAPAGRRKASAKS